MNRNNLRLARQKRSRVLSLVVLGTQLSACGFCVAGEEALPSPAQTSAVPSVHSDGVFDESYFQQLQRPMQSSIMMGRMPQANGRYNYGFPMHSYRWGYFGAERHYPRVMWHQGYYGDKVRAAYRDGY